jgi:alpha-glucosidase
MFSTLKLALSLALLAGAAVPLAAQTGPVVLKSPDGALEMSIATMPRGVRPGAPVGNAPAESGQLAYRVVFRGKLMMDWSTLGLQFEDSSVLGSAVKITSPAQSAADATWKSVQGKANPIRDHFNAVTVQAVETGAPERKLTLEARAYDDGVAFRYIVPEQAAVKEARILNEVTQFRFTKDARTFPLISRGFQTSNEDDYHELSLSGLHPEYLINLPLLVNVPGVGWLGLTEADLEDYPNLFVTATSDRILGARLATRVENIETNADTAPSFDRAADAKLLSVIAQTPVKSGWRALMIADDPGRLVESNMVVNLNPPNAIGDTSWIKPGKTPWDWWNGGQVKSVARPGKNNDTIKAYINFSARNKFEYMLIDGGWSASMPAAEGSTRRRSDLTKSVPALDIPMLVDYAKSKGVRLLLWAHFRDMNDQMEAAFSLYEKWGIAGVKIDYMDRTDQWMVNWYRSTAKKAAEHHLVVDFHGAFKPDGMRRTFPNVLTREGVMGAEYNKWSTRITPRHNVTLAFTRMLAGPMDYTPGGFDNVTDAAFEPRNTLPMVKGTRAHQTALFVVFESELQMVSDTPDAYDGQKETEFLKAVPSIWDETRVVNGVPVKYITVARRSGNDWFVGSITDSEPRDLDVPLSFLGAGNYAAEIYADGPNAATQPKDSVRNVQTVTAKSTLKLKLAPGGGAAIRITPAK